MPIYLTFIHYGLLILAAGGLLYGAIVSEGHMRHRKWIRDQKRADKRAEMRRASRRARRAMV
jgi:cytochrome c biogenesis protein ResB